VTWPDVLVLVTLVVAFVSGYRNGVIREFIDLGSIILAWVAAGALAGTLAAGLSPSWHLAAASAHLIAFWILFLTVFVALRALGWALDRFTKLPVLRVVSGAGGGIVAMAKGVLILWLILFIALFFPIAPDVREALRHSKSVPMIELLDRPAIALINQSVPFPWYTRPIVNSTLRHHHL